MSLAQTELKDAYGQDFGGRGRLQTSTGSTGPLVQPEFTSLAQKAQSSIQANAKTIQTLLTSGSLPLADPPVTHESFRVEEVPPPVRERMREHFTERPTSSNDTDDKLARILRLIEQNKTGYERPAVQDLVLYVFTGVFFLFTLDTFVLLGKTMRKIKKA